MTPDQLPTFWLDNRKGTAQVTGRGGKCVSFIIPVMH